MNEAIQEAIKPENNPYKGQVTVSNIIDAHDPEWKKANPVKAAQIYATRTAEEGSNDDRAWEAYADQKLEESIDTNVRPLAEAQTAKSFANGVRFQKTPQDKASFILNSLDRRSYISRDTEFTILVEELQKIADAPKEENQKPDRIPLDIYNTEKESLPMEPMLAPKLPTKLPMLPTEKLFITCFASSRSFAVNDIPSPTIPLRSISIDQSSTTLRT